MANQRSGPDYLDEEEKNRKRMRQKSHKKKKKTDDPSDYVGNFEQVMNRIRSRKKSKIQNF